MKTTRKISYRIHLPTVVPILAMAFMALWLFSVPAAFGQDHANPFLGTWLTGDKKSKVEIYKEKTGKYCGRIVWDEQPKTKDGKNKIGMLLLKDFDLEKDELVNGKVIDPDSGKEYSCKLLAENANTLAMKVKYGLLSFNDELTRTK